MTESQGPINLAQYSRDNILNADDLRLALIFSKLILEYAVLGYSEESLRLLSKLNTFSPNHSQQFLLRPLWFLWDTIGQWPSGEKERVVNEIQELRRSKQKAITGRGTGPSAKQAKFEMTPVTEQDVKEHLDRVARMYAQAWFFPGQFLRDLGPEEKPPRGPHHVSLGPREKALTIRGILDAFDERGGDDMTVVAPGYISAFELKFGLEEEGENAVAGDSIPSARELFEKIVKRIDEDHKWQLNFLVQSRRVWGLLKGGEVRKVLEVNEERLEAFMKEIGGYLDQRLEKGPPDPAEWSMKKILEKMEWNTQNVPPKDDEDFGELDRTKSLFRHPATPKQIASLEERLGAKLPEDYKEFLRITNGFGQVYTGVTLEPEFHSMDHLRWLVDDDDEHDDVEYVSLALDIPECMSFLFDDYESEYVRVGRVLEIASEDIDNYWLIPPAKVAETKQAIRAILEGDVHGENAKNKTRNYVVHFAGSEEEWEKTEWCCMNWDAGIAEMIAWPSFTACLRARAEDGRRVWEGEGTTDVLGSGSLGGFLGFRFRNVVVEEEEKEEDEDGEDGGEEEDEGEEIEED